MGGSWYLSDMSTPEIATRQITYVEKPFTLQSEQSGNWVYMHCLMLSSSLPVPHM